MTPARWRLLIVGCAAAGTLIKLWLATHSFGTNDMLFYQEYWQKSLAPAGGVGLYLDGVLLVDDAGVVYHHERYMNPPFVIHLMRVCGWLSHRLGGTFAFWMRAPSILADLGILALLWKLARPTTAADHLALVIAALSPVSILISGFHGSTDAVLVFFLMLAVWLAERNTLWAGMAYGMSLNIKVWPLIFLVAILARLGDRRLGMRFAAGALLAVAAGSTPFLWQAPRLVTSRLLESGFVYGYWGVSLLLEAGGPTVANELFRAYGKYLVVGALAALGAWLQVARPGSSLAWRVALITSFFMAAAPGFGVQYLVWLAPWGVLAGPRVLAAFSISGGLLTYMLYDYWSAGGWDLANSIVRWRWPKLAVGLGLVCWASVVVLAWIIWRRPGADGAATDGAHETRASAARPPRP